MALLLYELNGIAHMLFPIHDFYSLCLDAVSSRTLTQPRRRESIVEYALKPILRKLGIPEKDCGLHAFRHGLATELAEASVPITVLQQQLRSRGREDDSTGVRSRYF